MEKLGLQLLELLNSGVDLLSAELPLFVDEIITYKTIVYSIWVVLSIVFIPYAISGHKKALREHEKDYPSRSYVEIFDLMEYISFHRLWFAILFGINGVVSLFKLIKITLAPRIWLLEYATSLISK